MATAAKVMMTFFMIRCKLVVFTVAAEGLAYPVAVEAGDVLAFYLLGAFGLAGVGVGAAAEAEFVHLDDHLAGAVHGLGVALRQQVEVAHLGADEEHGAGILAGRHAGAAADAGGSIHSLVGDVLGHKDIVGVGHAAGGGADVAAGLDDFVEGGAVHHKVFDDGEGLGAPGLHPYLVAVVEVAHVQLAGGDAVVVAVGTAVDVEAAHAADTLAAVVVEAHRVGNAVVDKLFVELVKHFEERAVGADVVNLVGLEVPFGAGVLLAPYM